MALTATFVRHRGRRDRVYVVRSDSTTTGWDFPSYADNAPHDLCHLVVEDALGMAQGFWGLLDQGVDVGLIDNQSTLLRDGRPWVEGCDDPSSLEGLRRAEAAVARLAGMSAGPAAARTTAEATALTRLAELRQTWAALPDGGAVTLEFAL